MKFRFGAAAVAYLAAFSLFAAQAQPIQYRDADNINNVNVSVANPLPVDASVSASITGFPGASPSTGTPFTADTNAETGTLPAGAVVVVSNVGSSIGAYCKLGASATTSDQLIPPQSWFAFTVGAATQVTCITGSSTTTINMVGGAGLPTGSGGGGGGGGSGGAVAGAIAHDADATGSNPVTVGGYASAAAPTGVSADGDAVRAWNLRNGARATVITAAGALVGGDATNGLDVDVTRMSALVAGSAIIGNVRIDQTTPGTTNGVSATNAGTFAVQPAGSVAHDAVGTGVNPVLEGCYASAAAPTDVSADGDAVRGWCTRNGARAVYVTNNGTAQGAAIAGQTPSTIGAQTLTSNPTAYTTATTNPITINEYGGVLTQPYTLNAGRVQGAITTPMTGTTSTSLLAAPGANLYNYITNISCQNAHGTVGTLVAVQDGSGGTTLFHVAAAALFGGDNKGLLVPWKQTTANTALYVANVTTGASTTCMATGYKAP